MLRKERFPEHITPFLREKISFLEQIGGKDSIGYHALADQYLYDEREENVLNFETLRHYEADTNETNIERLYKEHCCIELNFSCVAYCRICLRNSYEKFVLTDEQIENAAKYSQANKLNEVLITGGDTFLSIKKLALLVDKIIDYCPDMRIIRIATRLFTQDPYRINNDVLRLLSSIKRRIRVEVATQIGHPLELSFKEVSDSFKKVIDLEIPVYAQNVFTKIINSSEELIKLYQLMRYIGIIPHYLFHSCPIVGTQHLRPTIKKMIDFYEDLVNSGEVTGRGKPLLAIMSSIGKITLTPFNVLEYKEGEFIKLKSRYKYSDRLLYNPNWKIPNEAWVDDSGYLCVKYPDGEN
jgi:lysine 2,3-aminomutase